MQQNIWLIQVCSLTQLSHFKFCIFYLIVSFLWMMMMHRDNVHSENTTSAVSFFRWYQKETEGGDVVTWFRGTTLWKKSVEVWCWNICKTFSIDSICNRRNSQNISSKHLLMILEFGCLVLIETIDLFPEQVIINVYSLINPQETSTGTRKPPHTEVDPGLLIRHDGRGECEELIWRRRIPLRAVWGRRGETMIIKENQ